MAKTFQPTIYCPPNPIGLDLEVFLIQKKLAAITWLQAIFGIAHLQTRFKSEQESQSMANIGFRGSLRYEHTYPQGKKYQGASYNAPDEDLTFNDSYASRAFFFVRDNIDIDPKTDGWNWVQKDQLISQPISLILHCNQSSLQMDNYEQAKTDILYALGNCPHVIGKMAFENMDNVWKEFTITPEINGCTRYPNYCLRVDFQINYLLVPSNGAPGYTPSILNRVVIGWTTFQIFIEVVDTPDGSTQTLINGDVIPIQYTANLDGTLTVPYLKSVYGISLLTYFMVNGSPYQGQFFVNGVINLGSVGPIGTGDGLNFDANIPIWSH